MNSSRSVILTIFLLLTILHESESAKLSKNIMGMTITEKNVAKPHTIGSKDKPSLLKPAARKNKSQCGHLRQPLTPGCSGRWELHNPSIESWFTTCTTNDFFIDNGNPYSVQYRLQCGWSHPEHNWVSKHTCGVIRRTPSSSYCYIRTITSGWIGVWTCCV